MSEQKGIQFGPKKLNLHMEPGVSRLVAVDVDEAMEMVAQ